MKVSMPEDLRLHKLTNCDGAPYYLVFSTAHSDYDSWIMHLGGPDENGKLIQSLLTSGSVFIDVGANIGTLSIPAARHCRKVITVEINPLNNLRLWLGAVANEIRNIHIISAAASNHDGITYFSGSEAWGHIVADPNAGTPCVSLKLDTMLRPFENDLSQGTPVLKIDVEGHESHTLRGAEQILAKYRPYVLIESIDIEGLHDTDARHAKKFLESALYTLFLINKNKLIPRKSSDLQENHVADFIAVPNELTSDFVANGFVIADLDKNEMLEIVDNMSSHPLIHHRRHAVGVLIRWSKENSEMFSLAKDISVRLIEDSELQEITPPLIESMGK